jgi:hypothetical protein
MKRLLLILLALSASIANAQLILSNFSSFTPDYYSQPFPADSTSWSELTAQSGATTFAIGSFGNGSAGGAIGNGFINFLSVATDWSAYTSVTLSGFASQANATPSLSFYLEDENVSSALSTFTLADFGFGPNSTDVTIPLSFLGIDATHVTAWGFVVQEADNPVFAFTFDQVSLALPTQVGAVPEPSTMGAIGGLVLLAAIGGRRYLRKR